MCFHCVREAANVLSQAPGLRLGPGGAADLLSALHRNTDPSLAWGLLGDEADNLREGCTTPSRAIGRASAGLLCWLLAGERASCLGTDARAVAPSSRKMILSGSTLTYETSSRGCLLGRQYLPGSATTADASPARRTKIR